ncbi:hypothetical protein [Desulfobacula sp.]|uniref:hypothetical protein n=1 Tax=Desulfobacula sp. TaxID=2593537 RepID=UPI0025BC18B4|nr:hypothetical protein [Desulfobacula sp.]MBC2702952.1 hypothetical protein [Desulfobacula sp.]
MKNDQKISNFPKIRNLADKKSVRTTFKLSNKCINVLNKLLETHNIRPKELFDLICIDNIIDSISDFQSNTTRKINKDSSVQLIRKTFVISKGALRIFNKKSEEFKLSRDSVVERIILIYKALLDSVTEIERKKEKKAYSIISDFVQKADDIENKLECLLRNDDPILERFGLIIVIIQNLQMAIQSKLEDGVLIDPDDFSQS